MIERVKALIALSVLATARVAVADCARVDHTSDLITKDAAALPADGGVLVGWKDLVNGEKNDDPSHPKWKFSTGFTAETLAPGLALHRPKAAGNVDVTDAKGGKIASFTRDTKASAAPDAPKPTKLELSSKPIRYGEMRIATAHLATAVPAGVVAVITYAQRGTQRIALGYMKIAPGAVDIATFSDPGRCSFLPKGMEPPHPKERVTLAYVDQFGRVGKPSVAITAK